METALLLEEHLTLGLTWVRLGIESVGAALIVFGVLMATARLLRRFDRAGEGFGGVRLLLARYLALGLEFQLAADILATAIAPTWDQLGKLAAIAVIRTGLNYFLQREMREETERQRA